MNTYSIAFATNDDVISLMIISQKSLYIIVWDWLIEYQVFPKIFQSSWSVH